MRNVRLSLDDDNNIVVTDQDGAEYRFHGYAQAMTPNPPLQKIVASELLNDLRAYTLWMEGVSPATLDLRAFLREQAQLPQ